MTVTPQNNNPLNYHIVQLWTDLPQCPTRNDFQLWVCFTVWWPAWEATVLWKSTIAAPQEHSCCGICYRHGFWFLVFCFLFFFLDYVDYILTCHFTSGLCLFFHPFHFHSLHLIFSPCVFKSVCPLLLVSLSVFIPHFLCSFVSPFYLHFTSVPRVILVCTTNLYMFSLAAFVVWNPFFKL